jgi:hypothetical protein
MNTGGFNTVAPSVSLGASGGRFPTKVDNSLKMKSNLQAVVNIKSPSAKIEEPSINAPNLNTNIKGPNI